MPSVDDDNIPSELVLGVRYNAHVPAADQRRQRDEVAEILRRLQRQPGVVLADEVGMGKTFVALAVAYCTATQSRRGPVIVMVPANLIDKWVQDLKTFCELYLDGRQPILRSGSSGGQHRDKTAVRYGIARHSVELMRLLDDTPSTRCHLIFLAQGSMARQQTDKWIRLALIREALNRHGRGRAERLIQVKRHIHRFVAELLWAIGEQRASDWGEALWRSLLDSHPRAWKELYNGSLRDDCHCLAEDPVPGAVLDALSAVDLQPLAEKLEQMPVRARGGASRVSERISEAREALKSVVRDLWGRVLAGTRWKSPLLVMDEAHHLKNPGTSLARQLQSPESDDDLRTGDGALARTFDRMLFLTATPFQLGHQELVRILERFGDVHWDRASLGEKTDFEGRLTGLGDSLTESQRTAIALQRCWSRLGLEEAPKGDADRWWQSLQATSSEKLTPRLRALRDAFEQARRWRSDAEAQLRPWLLRHNKGELWPGTQVARRKRVEGAAIADEAHLGAGLDVPPTQLLPFFLAARSAVSPGKDLLGEALCSSYEAFRYTRENRAEERDDQDEEPAPADLTHSGWYLSEFDASLGKLSGSIHPKVHATVQKTVDLWESGEKVLVFAFYRHTCRALRVHISQEIERRLTSLARRRFAGARRAINDGDLGPVLEGIQKRYFDDLKSPARKALDRALRAIVDRREEDLDKAGVPQDQQERLVEVMRRFLRVATTLVRCFPIHEYDTTKPHLAVRSMLDSEDRSGLSWRRKFEAFIDFLIDRCSATERDSYLEAAVRMQTGEIRVEAEDLAGEQGEDGEAQMTLANVQEATGKTKREQRSRLMRAFNTPFFPDVLVCSQVMGEGVDLQRYCSSVIHHDLDWNPSKIEQRTGRIDRLGCKAELTHPIHVYLPYLSGAADERQFRVMTDREQWFRIVMGQDEVAKLIPRDDGCERPDLPAAFSEELTFHLGLESSAREVSPKPR
jgi:ERCC4-related helicase